MPEPRPLTPKQQRFVDEYLIDLNATQAAIRAGYSAKTAHVAGPRDLLANPRVSAAIAERQQAVSERLQVSQERVLQEYARIAFADMRRFAHVNAGGVVLVDSEDWTDDDAAAVAEVSESTSKDGGSIKFKLHNKVQALDALSKHLGLFAADKGEPSNEYHQHVHLEGLTLDERRALAEYARRFDG